MSSKFAIILTAALLMTGFIAWLSLTPSAAGKFANSKPLPFVLAVIGLSGIYPLFLAVKRWPHLRLGIGMLLTSIVLTVIVALQYFSFHQDGFWFHTLFNASQILFILGNVSIVWQGIRGRH